MAEQKFGDLLVGRSFNPSNNPKVDRIKEICAELANIVTEHPTQDNALSQIVLQSALSSILTAQMTAVKFVTL